eukprot:scaffold8454_cov113-Skeletonema_marinoi.AAC.1
MGTHEHNDEILSTGGDNKISAPPPAAASTYYTSFNEEAEYSTSIIDSTPVVNQPPPAAATTNNNNSASKKASIEYEQLLSSTIISLFQKFVPALHQRLSSSSNNNNNDDETKSELVLQSSRSLEFADGYGGNYKTTGLDINDDDDNDAVLDVESQSFGAASSPYHPSERISTATTPKVSNLKTTGLLDSDTIDNDECIHNYTNYHHHHQSHQQQHQLQRQHSNSSTEYLPQSAAVLLNTLQHTNFDRGAEEILSSILRSGGSSSFDDGDTNVREGGGGGEGSGELVVDGNHDGVAVNADGSMSKKKKPPAATINTQYAATKSTNSFEHQSQQQQQQQHNYDDDDDNSISGDMARLSKSIAHLQRDLDNIDMSRFDGMVDMEQQQQQQQQDLLDGGSRGNGWKRWIRNWLLSHGIIEDEKMVNSLLSNDNERGEGDDDGSIITPGRGGFTIFDFERDYVLVLTLLLVFFVLLRNRFKTMNELMFEEEDNQDLEGLLGGSDW